MNRWITAGLAVLVAGIVIAVVVGLVVLWPTSDRSPTPGAGSTGGTPAPSATPSSGRPSGTLPTLPTGPGTTLSPCPDPGPPVRLAVLTFNMHSGFARGRLDLEGIARAVEASGADVVLLQEVDRFRRNSGAVDQAAVLAQRLGWHSAYGPNGLRPRARPGLPLGAIGNAILSRFPLDRVSNTHLPNRPGLEARGLLRAEVTVRGRRVAMYATHLQHTSSSVRVAQARAVAAAVRRDRLPKVVGGDLNAVPGSPALRSVLRAGLTDTWPAAGAGPGLTVPAVVPHRRIDFLLHDAALRALSADVLSTGLSDHRAVRGRFELPRGDGC
jgi:endonuclease/exonuclease/phosphatase family metal-dependent hydrolase